MPESARECLHIATHMCKCVSVCAQHQECKGFVCIHVSEWKCPDCVRTCWRYKGVFAHGWGCAHTQVCKGMSSGGSGV